jgi:hypothetical protein
MCRSPYAARTPVADRNPGLITVDDRAPTERVLLVISPAV